MILSIRQNQNQQTGTQTYNKEKKYPNWENIGALAPVLTFFNYNSSQNSRKPADSVVQNSSVELTYDTLQWSDYATNADCVAEKVSFAPLCNTLH